MTAKWTLTLPESVWDAFESHLLAAAERSRGTFPEPVREWPREMREIAEAYDGVCAAVARWEPDRRDSPLMDEPRREFVIKGIPQFGVVIDTLRLLRRDSPGDRFGHVASRGTATIMRMMREDVVTRLARLACVENRLDL